MLKIEKVLFATDFSPISEKAFHYATRIAQAHKARLHLFHVNVLAEDEPWGGAHPSPDFEKLWTVRSGWAEARLEEISKDPGLRELALSQEVCWDLSAARAIAHHAAEEGTDLVVMGTHGSRGVRKWLLGSVAAEVIRTAPCSVLTVPPQGDLPMHPSFRKILAPVDFSVCSREGLSVACELALGYGARLELLHVRGTHSGSLPPGTTHIHEEDDLRWFLRDVSGRKVIPAGFSLSEGHPGREIPLFAEAGAFDLIVLANLGATGIDDFLLGSTAERVIGAAQCPVLVVRPPGKSLVYR